MERIEITPKGVCSKKIVVEVNNGHIQTVTFSGGCSGQSNVLNKLLRNMPIELAANMLKGITCGKRQTSCSDQLAIGLESCLEEHSQPCIFNCDHCSANKYEACRQKFNE